MKLSSRLYLCCSLLIVTNIVSTDAHAAATNIEQGKDIAFNRNKGNCLSCHFVQGAEMTGSIAPPLLQMELRYPDRDKLRAQIWDATVRNTESVMPPYGRHGILTEKEIDLVLDYVYSL
ncbi:MAG: sulfur oxidation c-type cytochrome SoxX [bacterium]|nr:sulfur oxidation c-type cytochrome SoxX [Gammaproteobacteria bacterium]HIL96991.1 sulfur oxidation c-type cytochrome SoxX [Pseudomonadales bacterium]